MLGSNPARTESVFFTARLSNVARAADQLHVSPELFEPRRVGSDARLVNHPQVLRHEARPRVQRSAGPEVVPELRARPDGLEHQLEAVAAGHRRPDPVVTRALQAEHGRAVQGFCLRRTEVSSSSRNFHGCSLYSPRGLCIN